MSTRPLWYRWVRVYAVGGAIVGTGLLLYKYATPTDEELIARFSPEVRRKYEENRALRQKEQQELMEIVKKTAASKDPIWITGSVKSPSEWREEQKANRERKERSAAELVQRAEIEKAKLELQQTEALAQTAEKKGWFKG
ncbi:hypothetical protein BABINDRAFT_9498 [Babjeviella inositovora NRRL Y-12698]|uniref:Cytochrome b mRNA-processing protein 4 n=1 Tax=Babjeviella inositovora NRRL Y-12698 TaxID=984486 RepID=A0A1E3QKT0_9ASCO|nr:uncharacterized protein BABINDRAFT_9498 [Babjeviella inositovora NRRL Y-12698]ODQ78285.1 hypothetical protein BABINDRAFT_9498 [Babjeviella inositovora NRRL Y-12698]